MLRLKLAERLVKVKNETAMLTTFNEINMRTDSKMKVLTMTVSGKNSAQGLVLCPFFAKAVALLL